MTTRCGIFGHMADTRSNVPSGLGTRGGAILAVALFAILLPTSRYNYLLFHSLVEMVAAVVAFSVFVIAWNTRRIVSNRYLLVLGVTQLFVGAVLFLHLLSYKGMGVFTAYQADLPTQLWIVARLLVASSFLVAGISLRRPLRIGAVFIAFGIATALALSAIAVGVFPTMHVEGVGLTPVKIAAEYLTMLIAAGAFLLLHRNRNRFERRVVVLLMSAIVTMILAELAFTLYVDVYGALNFVGHLLALGSIMLIYMAVVDTALVRPYSLLFFELKRREEAEREIADTLQSAMLMAPARVDTLEMGHAYVSATGLARVGGDFFDLFEPARGFVSFVIGDVCGKGIEAAASTTMVRATIRGFAYHDTDPGAVLGRSNESLAHQFATDKFATAIYGVLGSDTGRLRLASAGHPAPVLCRGNDVSYVDIPRNPPLSIRTDWEFEVNEIQLEDGDTLILFTDGLLDAGWHTEAFGPERILEHAARVAGLPPMEIADALLSAARAHAGDDLADDVAILVLRYAAPSPTTIAGAGGFVANVSTAASTQSPAAIA